MTRRDEAIKRRFKNKNSMGTMKFRDDYVDTEGVRDWRGQTEELFQQFLDFRAKKVAGKRRNRARKG